MHGGRSEDPREREPMRGPIGEPPHSERAAAIVKSERPDRSVRGSEDREEWLG